MATHATLAPRRSSRRRFRRAGRPRVRKLRLVFVLATFVGLATLSLLFGMLTSVAADLPGLQDAAVFSHYVDSYMYDEDGNPIGPLAPASTPAIDNWSDISQNMVHAIVSVEDRGFWSESGISVRGLLRAAYSDLTGGPTEGGSTIPEEFIKNVRAQENHRTVLEKLVEAGMAFQLTHVWPHRKILTQYLNTIYFGNGALGIEAAARVYFGSAPNVEYDAANASDGSKSGCGTSNAEDPHRRECASLLTPAQAALLAAMVANPSAFDPIQHPKAALARRNDVVLKDMYEQHYISYRQYVQAKATPLPTRNDLQQPEEPSAAPYFTSWVEPLVIRALEKEGLSPQKAQYEAYYGGLKITLSLNDQMQYDAQQAVDEELPPYSSLPTASLVAIDNSTGQVRAMVSGNDNNYGQQPFNLATLGYRQPGSSFKLFTLAAALSAGTITPDSDVDSKQITIPFVKQGGNAFAAANGTGRFPVHNFGNVYSGEIPMTVATATSDNSVFAQVGMKIGTALVASYARRMGIRSPISRNPSMILGGLNTGVSALDMAHAYSTEANGGVKVYDPILGDIKQGPIGIDSISGNWNGSYHDITASGTERRPRVLKSTVATEIDELLHGPVDDSYGTGTAAAISGVNVAGKTGTTSNYVDAWFCGWTKPLTVCVWVGYVNGGKPMLTQFDGKPVEGGTYPALIFHNFMVQALQVLAQKANAKTSTLTAPTSTEVVPTTSQSTPLSQTTASSTATTPAATSTSPATTSSAAANSSASATTPSTPQPSAAQPTTTPAVIPPGSSTSANGGSGI